MLGARNSRNQRASTATAWSMPPASRNSEPTRMGTVSATASPPDTQTPCQKISRARAGRPAPRDCAIRPSRPTSTPMPKMTPAMNTALASPTPASWVVPARPTTAVSTSPISAVPPLEMAIGAASFNIGPKPVRFSSLIVPEPDSTRPSQSPGRTSSHKPDGPVARLPGRPLQRAPGQKVQVDVEHRLPGVAPVVHHHPVPLTVPPLLGDLGGGDEEVAHLLAVLQREVVDAGDVLERDEEHVHRRHRPDVLEAEAHLIAVDDLGRNLAVPDLAEQTVGHAGRS